MACACSYSWAEIGSRLGITRKVAPAALGDNGEHGRCHIRAEDDSNRLAGDGQSHATDLPCWLYEFAGL